MKKNGNRKQLPFTLIELVIVIAILGALVALILPAFSTTEKDAKETSDAYNSRGVVRYVQMFQNANGYYPSGFHTGQQSGMKTMNASLLELVRANKLHPQSAVEWSLEKEDMKRVLASSGFAP